MLPRRSCFVIIPLIALAAGELQNDLSRIKRSPYHCPPSQPALPPPQPPPPAPPPVPLPRSFSYPSPAYSGLHWEQFIRHQTYNDRNSEDQGQRDAQPYSTGYDHNQFGNYNGRDRPPCEKCGRKNLAISNSQSDTGDAISIAVSNGNRG